MERNKRDAKPPEPYIIPAICYPRIRKKKPKKKAPEKAQYQMIPYPLKFIYTQKIFCLYAVNSLPFLFFSIDSFPLLNFFRVSVFASIKELFIQKVVS